MKKKFNPLLLCLLLFLAQRGIVFSAIYENTNEDLEFGVTSMDGTRDIWSFETGYNGSYGFQFQDYKGLAQTFKVPSDTILGSVQLRVGAGYISTGQFEIAVYVFNTVHRSFSAKIAHTLANAGDYDGYNYSVPVSTFDMSSFNVLLDSSETYALAISPLDSFVGKLSLQAQVDNYPNGNTIIFYSPILEPEPLILVGLEISGPYELIGGGSGQYSAIALYDNGSEVDVTNFVEWSLSSDEFATIDDSGLVTCGGVDFDGEFFVEAQYTEDGIVVETETLVLFLDDPRTIIVNPDGSGDYTTIQAGINAAVSGVDTVEVAVGTYYENINFNDKDIVLTSTDPNNPSIVESTIINGSNADSTVLFVNGESSNCELKGFTITGGNASINSRGGGIDCLASSPTISSCIIIGNHSRAGGGMRISNSSSVPSQPTIINCEFISNTADQPGGGIYCDHSISKLINCTFIGNSAKSGAGMYIVYSDTKIINCLFLNNIAETRTGGLEVNSSSASVVNCTFVGNSAPEGGGIRYYCSSSSTIELVNSILWNNYGSQVNIGWNSDLFINHCNIQGGRGGIEKERDPWSRPRYNWGIGNLDADPLFADHGSSDYHLLEESPCIDVGDNSVIDPESTDLAGNPRIFNESVDMGAYEFFVPVTIVGLEISGPNEVSDGGFGEYSAVAFYDDGSEVDVTDSVDWSLSSEEFAVIDSNGLVVCSGADHEGEFTVYARYTENEIVVDAEKLVRYLPVFVSSWSVVSKNRVGRSMFEYECEVDVTNVSSADLYDVSLELVDGSGQLIISDPDVYFGDILSGQTVTSIDTFTIMIDRNNPAGLDSLYWRVSFAAAPAPPLATQSFMVGATFEIADFDFNDDGVVDIDDLRVFASQWLQSGSFDVTGSEGQPDGIVNLLDFAVLANELD